MKSILFKQVTGAIIALFIYSGLYSQVNTEKYRKEYKDKGFIFNNSFVFSFVDGNSKYSSVSESFRIDYNGIKMDYFMVANYNFKKAKEEKLVNKGFLHVRAIRMLSPRVYIETFGQKEFNEFISLNDRNLLGGGIRLKAVEYFNADSSSSFTAYIGMGAMYENELYDIDDSTQIENNFARSTNYLTFNWEINDKISLNNVTYFQPNLSDLNNFRLISDFGVDIKIFKKIYFMVSVHTRYDNDPVKEGVENYDITIKNGLRFKFP